MPEVHVQQIWQNSQAYQPMEQLVMLKKTQRTWAVVKLRTTLDIVICQGFWFLALAAGFTKNKNTLWKG